MKKNFVFGCLLLSFIARAQEPLRDYTFFVNSRMSGSYFFSKASFQAPSTITNIEGKLPVSERNFFTPGNALQLEYLNAADGNWSAAIYKPQMRGQDHFKPAEYLSMHVFNASTAEGGLPAVQLMKADSSVSKKYTFQLSTNAGEQIIIPVDSFEMQFMHADEIIAVIFSQNENDKKTHNLYIDDIEFLSSANVINVTATPEITNAKGYAKHIDIEWAAFKDTAVKYVKIYRSGDGNNFYPVGIQTPGIFRYSDYTGETNKAYLYKIAFLDYDYNESKVTGTVVGKTRTLTDSAMLSMVQEACFRYYWEGAEKNSGLAKENIQGRENMIATGASGFGIMALIVGTERKFISREASVERFLQITDFLSATQTFHGAFAHFVDGPTKKVEPFFGEKDNGGDLVETSFLIQGLLAAKAYFSQDNEKEKTIRDRITEIWERVEWDWYKQFPGSKFLYWHWSPDKAWILNHNLIGWNETMVTYLLAIASPTHAVRASMYYTGWANQEKKGQDYRSGWGGTKEGSMYTNGNVYEGIKLEVGVSNGGPLFFTHYSYLGYDPHFITDKYTNYFTNNKNIANINLHYCIRNPNNYKDYSDSCWGLTASDGPFSYTADEPMKSRDIGKIAPTGAISSFPYTPEASMKALRNYYNSYGKFLWGEYGFRDAFDLNQNWCSEIYMGLNQAPMTVMIENYRTGLIWRLFMSNPDIQSGLKKLNEETGKQ